MFYKFRDILIKTPNHIIMISVMISQKFITIKKLLVDNKNVINTYYFHFLYMFANINILSNLSTWLRSHNIWSLNNPLMQILGTLLYLNKCIIGNLL